MTLTKGAGSGGALYNDGISTLDNVTVTDASPDSSAVYSSYKLTVLNSRIKDNFKGIVSAVNFSGSSWVLEIEDSLFENNSGGRALYSDAVSTRISNTQFLTNSGGGAYFESGTIYIDSSDFVGNSAANGAAVQSVADLTVTNSSFTGNTATQGGGALWVSGRASIIDSTVKDNSVRSNGGGIHSYAALVLERVELVNNEATIGQGGGIYQFRGSLQIYDSIVSDNSAGTFGGGAYINVEFGGGGYSLLHSEFSANTAKNGGGIYAYANVTIKNITISGNVATVSGGGIVNSRSTLALINTTVSSNEAPNGANLKSLNGGLFRLSNTLVANPVGSLSCDGSVTSTGYNLDTDDSCELAEIGDLPSSNLRLGALADNGGETRTHALGSDSDAIDAGDPNVCLNSSRLDQRYYYRSDSRCDIGAYEYGSVRALSGEVAFPTAETQAREGERAATVVVRRTGGSEGAILANVYSTGYGAALGSSDFKSVDVDLEWADGDIEDKVVEIILVNDSLYEGTEEFWLKLRRVGSSASLGSQIDHVVTLYDDEAKPGTLSFVSSSKSVDEDAGTVSLTVLRTQGSFGTVSVDYNSVDDTATSGSDYSAASGTLTFLDGETSKTITIDIAGDSEAESSESFRVVLSNPVNGALLGSNFDLRVDITEGRGEVGTSGEAEIIIGSSTFIVSGQSVGEGDGSIDITLTILGGGSEVVDFETTSTEGTASPFDFRPSRGRLFFTAGVVSKTISVEILDDSVVEGDESFKLMFFDAMGWLTGGASASISIIIRDDDTVQEDPVVGHFSFAEVTQSVDEGDGFVVVEVIRSGSSSGEVAVDYSTVSGSAEPRSDYSHVSGTLVFADGVASQTITIAVIDDSILEGDQAFSVELSNPVGALLSNANTTSTVTINDNEVAPTPKPGIISIEKERYTVDENLLGLREFIFKLVRTGGTDGEVSVNITLIDGDAVFQSDYDSVGTSAPTQKIRVNFNDGQSEVLFAVSILDDDIPEPDESFTVRLVSTLGGATLGAVDRTVITIKDNDGPVALPASSIVNDSSGDGTQIGAIHPLVLLFAVFWWVAGAARRRRAGSR